MGIMVSRGAIVKLPLGELRALASVKVGDVLLGKDSPNNIIGLLRSKAPRRLYGIRSGQAGPFFSDEQVVWTKAGWKAIDQVKAQAGNLDLKIGWLTNEDVIPHANGDIPLLSIYTITPHEAEEILDLSLDGDHTFYVEGVLFHNKGGSSTQTSTDYNSQQKPLVNDLFTLATGGLEGLLGIKRGEKGEILSYDFPKYEGSFVADPTKNQQGLALADQVARASVGTNSGKDLGDFFTKQILGGTLSNTAAQKFNYAPSIGVNDAITAAITPVKQNLLENILPTIQSAATANNAYAGAGSALESLQGRAVRDYGQTTADIAAKYGYQDFTDTRNLAFHDFQNSRQAQLQAAGIEGSLAALAPTLQSASVTNDLNAANVLKSTGDVRTANAQAGIDEQRAQFANLIQGAFAGLPEFQSLIFGGANPTSSVSQTTGRSGVQGALLGGLGGAGLGSALSSAGVLGAGTGALASTGVGIPLAIALGAAGGAKG